MRHSRPVVPTAKTINVATKIAVLSASIHRSAALSAQAFVVLDLVLMAAAFAAARSGNAGLMCYSFGLHFLAALTVRSSSEFFPFFVFAFIRFAKNQVGGLEWTYIHTCLAFWVP